MVAIVTDVHYRMSLALIRDLGEAGIDVICCESDRYRVDRSSPPLGALSHFCKCNVWLPENAYIESLLDLCREVGKEYRAKPALLPVGAATLALISENRSAFDAVCGLLIPTAEQLQHFNSKIRLAELAKSLSLPTPKSFSREDGETAEEFFKRIDYPCVIKPVCGEKLGLSAAKRYLFADTPDQALPAFNTFRDLAGEDPVVQHRLVGSGYGCSVLAMEGTIVHSICHRRVREYPVSGGPSSCCQAVDRPDLRAMAEKLVSHTGYSGLAMFEFKEDAEGNPYLLEVNPRVWGTFPLTRISKSGIPVLWCTLSWNAGNSEDIRVLPEIKTPEKRKMIFVISDLMAGINYLRRRKIGQAFGAVLDLLNPFVRDGLFEWNDCKPAFAYFKALLSKERH